MLTASYRISVSWISWEVKLYLYFRSFDPFCEASQIQEVFVHGLLGGTLTRIGQYGLKQTAFRVNSNTPHGIYKYPQSLSPYHVLGTLYLHNDMLFTFSRNIFKGGTMRQVNRTMVYMRFATPAMSDGYTKASLYPIPNT